MDGKWLLRCGFSNIVGVSCGEKDSMKSLAAWKDKSGGDFKKLPRFCGRDEATRTPDPYVPNVVRYQLRYIPMV